MYVRDSTRATSDGSELPRNEFGFFSSLRRVKVPASTSCVGQALPFLVGAVCEDDPIGLGQLGNLLHPGEQFPVLSGRRAVGSVETGNGR